MQDLDFDELDRAVNSLVKNTTSPTPGTEPMVQTLDLDGGSNQSIPIGPVTSLSTPPAQQPLAGRRGNGRFMDVVSPSLSTRVNPTMPERVSRQGLTISPDASLPMAPEVAPTPVVMPESKDIELSNPIASQGSDQNLADTNSSLILEDGEDADIDQISHDISNTLNNSANEPQDSLFLSGAKVEKRPLGAFSSEEAVTKPADTPPSSSPSSNTASSMPAEFHPDLLSIESDNTTVPNVPSMGDVADTTARLDTSSIQNTSVQPAANMQSDGPASITQQYSEQPSTGDQTTGAIYDTDSYHKAILAPTKKKSDLLLIIGIILLIVVGAGAGAAVYFFVLPR